MLIVPEGIKSITSGKDSGNHEEILAPWDLADHISPTHSKQKEKAESGAILQNSKSQTKGPVNFPNNTTNWGPSVQMSEAIYGKYFSKPHTWPFSSSLRVEIGLWKLKKCERQKSSTWLGKGGVSKRVRHILKGLRG